MMTTSLLSDLGPQLLLDLLVRGGLLLAAAWIGTWLLREASAALRHAVWVLAFAGLLLLPASALLPRIDVPVLPTVSAPLASTDADAPSRYDAVGNRYAVFNTKRTEHPAAHASGIGAAATPVATDAPTPSSAGAAGTAAHDANSLNTNSLNTNSLNTILMPLPVGLSTAAPFAAGTALPVEAAPAPPADWSWPALALLVWVAGALLGLFSLSIELVRLFAIRRRAHPPAADVWDDRMASACRRMGVRRPVRLLQHPAVRVPMTFGSLRPAVLLPPSADDWSDERARVVLLHELAHVSRWDFTVHLATACVRALHWPNPLVHLAARRLLMERERACDDRVLAAGADAPSYAETLVESARALLSPARVSLRGTLAMARPSELGERVRAILDARQPRQPVTAGGPLFSLAGLTLLIAFPLFFFSPVPLEAPASADTPGVPTPDAALPPPPLPAANSAVETDPADDLEDAADASSEVVAPEHSPPPTVASDAAAGTTSKPRTVRGDGAAHSDTLDSVATTHHAWEEALQQQFAQTRMVNRELQQERERGRVAIREPLQVWNQATSERAIPPSPADTTDGPTSEAELQKQAVFALSRLPAERSVPFLADIARTHPNTGIRQKAIFWLGQMGELDEVADILDDILRASDDPEMQEQTLFAISRLDEEQARPMLIEFARSDAPAALRAKAVFWLGQMGGGEVSRFFGELLSSATDPALQEQAVFALIRFPNNEGVPQLIRIAREHPDPEVRKKAIFHLGQSGDPRAADVLVEIARGQ